MSDCGLSVSFQPSGSTVLVLDGLTEVDFALTSLRSLQTLCWGDTEAFAFLADGDVP